MDPLNCTSEPIGIEDEDRLNDVDVEARKFAISVIGPFIVTVDGLLDPENAPTPLPDHTPKEYPEIGVARIVTGTLAFCQPEVGVTVPSLEGFSCIVRKY